MLRFNFLKVCFIMWRGRFQYILCYGSTRPFIKCKFGIINFNTSYVTVQLLETWGKSCVGRISIHPMLRFNSLRLIKEHVEFFKFQYILCYGSTIVQLWIYCALQAFQYILCYGSTKYFNRTSIISFHFNTSYVTVQQYQNYNKKHTKEYFNTSYVTVQRFGGG